MLILQSIWHKEENVVKKKEDRKISHVLMAIRTTRKRERGNNVKNENRKEKRDAMTIQIHEE